MRRVTWERYKVSEWEEWLEKDIKWVSERVTWVRYKVSEWEEWLEKDIKWVSEKSDLSKI